MTIKYVTTKKTDKFLEKCDLPKMTHENKKNNYEIKL